MDVKAEVQQILSDFHRRKRPEKSLDAEAVKVRTETMDEVPRKPRRRNKRNKSRERSAIRVPQADRPRRTRNKEKTASKVCKSEAAATSQIHT